MKLMTFLAALAFTTVASAFPAVQDRAEFKGVFQGGGGGSIDFLQSLEITGFDASSNIYTVRSTLTARGQNQAQEIQVAKDDLLDRARVQMVIANCPMAGGTAETLTVPAGTFQTCKIPQERGGEVWIAEVPFGIAKQVSVDEEMNVITVELTAFVNGQ